MQTTNRTLIAVLQERRRQDARFPNQSLPDGTSDSPEATWQRGFDQAQTDQAAESGELTWRHVLQEEVSEAFAEVDQAKLRVELIQVAAVACRWVEDIDRRVAQEAA